MPELDTRDRERLRDSQFAYIDRESGEHLPINDASHVRNAVARFNQTELRPPGPRSRGRLDADPLLTPAPRPLGP